MKWLIIDRLESNYAICEDEDKNCLAIEIASLPAEAAEGVVLAVSKDGSFSIDWDETMRRRARIAEKQRRFFEN